MNTSGDPDPDLSAEYDFSKGRRGRHAAAYAQGTNVVPIDPELLGAIDGVAEQEHTDRHDLIDRVLREYVRQKS